MPSQTTSPPLTVTVLAALWVSLGRCGVSGSPGQGCDNGKLFLDMDLSPGGVNSDCPVSTWPQSTQRLSSIDTVYHPEPARQICMGESISYNQTIPNSGAYRPVRAESGEYLYCPPQRWLNNLHHEATVLLYHPCAPLHDRLLVSVLARSCLPDYIISSHPQLSKHMPIALVSWGRTLELSSMASSDVCDWLVATVSTENRFGGVSQGMKYNLLLTWSAEQHRQQQAHPEEHFVKMKESLRQCCERTISSHVNGAMGAELESNMKKESWKQIKVEGKSRQIRAAIKGKQENVNENERDVSRDTLERTEDAQNNSTLGQSADSPPGNGTLSDPPFEVPSQSKIQNKNLGFTSRPVDLGSHMSKNTFRTESLGVRDSGSQKTRLQTAAQQPSPQQSVLRKPDPSPGLDVRIHGVNSEHIHTARPEAQTLSSKDEGIQSVKHSEGQSDSKDKQRVKDKTAGRSVKDNEVVDVKEREVEHKQTHSDTNSHYKSENTGFDSASKSPPQQQSQHLKSQTASYLPSSRDSGPEARAAVASQGLQRTPRTDEAVWAAAALGFLLVLLTLSVLHTRLYRHWRTAPSLYWHDPQQDYDSVADVIRRRLRIAKRRRKRGRRQECVLLPSSSSSDEDL